MKRTLILSVVIGIIFTMNSCTNSTTPTNIIINPFIGTWEHTTEDFFESLQFTDTEIMIIFQSLTAPGLEPQIFKGTYQFFDSVIILRLGAGNNLFADFSISGNNLTMTFSHTGATIIYTRA